jgi:hypothetical protein
LNHFKCRHPTHKKTDSDKWIKFKMQPVIATSAIPREARDWQCPWCDCGLPQCETKHQRAISIQKHYKDAHNRRMDKSQKAKLQAAAKRRKHDPVANERWLDVNKQKSESHRRLNEARRDLQTAGHDLVRFQPNLNTWTGTQRVATIARYTCKKCRRFTEYPEFALRPCGTPMRYANWWNCLDKDDKNFV